ncbi:MAG: abhydrolase domain-containing 18 [Candidatus Brocadia sp.]|nr:abhydrolase domain-containing 18 [Candidatus Brocadia sp.]
MIQYFMQAVDRLYFRAFPFKIRVPQRPDIYDFSSFTRKEYLENPELFYMKPERIPDFSITRVADVHCVKIFDVSFPSPVQTRYRENNAAYGIYFKTSGKKDSVSVILLHGWGRRNLWPEKKFARILARHNVNCFILKLPFHFERAPKGTFSGEYVLTGDISRTVEGTRQHIIEVRVVSSWLRKQGEKVGIVGISLGGMMAHLAMAVEAFDAGITLLGGGNNAGIIWEGIATNSVRDAHIKAGISREQANHIYQIVNPTLMAKHNKTKNLLMINGLYDEAVPVKFTTELWEALGRPKIRWYPCAHASMVFFAKSIIKDIIQFIHEIN